MTLNIICAIAAFLMTLAIGFWRRKKLLQRKERRDREFAISKKTQDDKLKIPVKKIPRKKGNWEVLFPAAEWKFCDGYIYDACSSLGVIIYSEQGWLRVGTNRPIDIDSAPDHLKFLADMPYGIRIDLYEWAAAQEYTGILDYADLDKEARMLRGYEKLKEIGVLG